MKINSIAALCCIGLLAGEFVSCGGHSDKSQESVDIKSFAYNQVLKSASRNYLLVIDGQPHYLNIGAVIEWPEKIGHHDISQLQDSLASYTFGDSIYSTPDDAIRNFIDGVKDLKDYFGEIDEISVVDSIPSDEPAFILKTEASMVDISRDYVTYKVSNSQYLGGAHGEVASLPFTFDLVNGKVMTPDSYFVEGDSVKSAVIDIVKESLAYQYGYTPQQLQKAGIFQYDNAGIGYPYIKDGILYIHYNPYDIAPYSAGSFDIPVNSVMISSYLTPEVKELIGYDYDY
ncbi:MAG: RsiV family protein [Duncaniella sp.]|nr:RsiV family protein [Duncaniella sp.]